MASQVRLTANVARVLQVFLEDPAEPRYGFDLMQVLGLASGTLYPILARLESAGWIVGQREAIDPVEAGRSPRRTYLLTPDGAELAADAVHRLQNQLRLGSAWRTAGLPREAPA
jgi:DNA-binding PadR family transcriptional regulator